MITLDQLLIVRSSLGRWRQGSKWTLLTENKDIEFSNSRKYTVQSFNGVSYTPIRRYNVTPAQFNEVVQVLTQEGYRLVEPTFPELQPFFRNGRPITAATMLEDSFEENMEQLDTTNFVDGLDALLASF